MNCSYTAVLFQIKTKGGYDSERQVRHLNTAPEGVHQRKQVIRLLSDKSGSLLGQTAAGIKT